MGPVFGRCYRGSAQHEMPQIDLTMMFGFLLEVGGPGHCYHRARYYPQPYIYIYTHTHTPTQPHPHTHTPAPKAVRTRSGLAKGCPELV